ncbi:MAG: SRPBCC domain-containing protein [Pseudomonadota bacterium]
MTESIPPLIKTVSLNVPQQRAFELFTAHVAHWWPLATYSVSAQIAQQPAQRCAFEPREGGAFYEIDAEGQHHVWGTVLRWRPHGQLTFSWHPGAPESQATTVDVRFDAICEDETRVVLTHHGWEARGDDARSARDDYDGGWELVLDGGLRAYAASEP